MKNAELPGDQASEPCDAVKKCLDDSLSLLAKYVRLPGRLKNSRVVVTIVIDGEFTRASPESCSALGLTPGNTVWESLELASLGERWPVYVQGQLAQEVLDLSNGRRIIAVARTLYGIGKQIESTDREGTYLVDTELMGLELKQLLQPQDEPADTDRPKERAYMMRPFGPSASVANQ
jgi:hypothetical protein